MKALSVLLPLLLSIAPAGAQAATEAFISRVGEADADGALIVELRFLNPDAAPATVPLPDRVQAHLLAGGRSSTVWLQRAQATPSSLTIAAGGFAQGRYRLAAGDGVEGALLSVPLWSAQQVAIARPALREAAVAMAVRDPEPAAASPPTVAPPVDRRAGNAFLENLAPYEPMYAVYGPGTNTDARLQLSFEYRLFGSRAAADLPSSWRDGLHLAYTQRMFWDLGSKSKPFRNIDYQPELIYISPSTTLDNGLSLAMQGGFRHESNGRDGADSRSINSLYVAPMAALPLAGGWRLLVAPRLSFYVGSKSDNPDIVRYRGHGGLFFQIGQEDGWRLSTYSRLNVGSGKGAINAELSYPLPRLLGGGPDVYLFAQGFAGNGENLLDYRKATTRLRLGIGLVR